MHPTLFVKAKRSLRLPSTWTRDVTEPNLVGKVVRCLCERDWRRHVLATPNGMRVWGERPGESDVVELEKADFQGRELYTPVDELRSLIDEENGNSLDILIAQLRSPVGVVPFVGAGLSVPFGFPGWPDFLKGAAAFHRRPEEILDLVRRNQLIQGCRGALQAES